MRLSLSVHGSELVSAVEVGTLAFKQVLAHQPERVDALARELVDVLARGNRAHNLSQHNLRNLRQAGEELFSLLVPAEVAQHLRGDDRSLYLQVDEQLVPVPWELLHDGEGHWCRRFDLGRAVTTPQAMIGHTAPIPSVGPLRMLVICSDPREDLDEVEAEGQRIVQRLDETTTVDVHLLVDPTVEAVRRALREHDLVHFAGHADHDPTNPERGGWHLRDGKLTAAAVGELGGGRMPLLVFSNACRSGQTAAWDAGGSPPPVYGLANAFLLAGVRHYLGTQWEVVDGQSASFAVAFYEALSRGASAGAAMRAAREAVIHQASDTSLAWASYVLYGDPETALVRLPESKTLPPSPSASLIEVRQSAPWKRPPPRYDRPPSSTVPKVTPSAPDEPPVEAARAPLARGPNWLLLLGVGTLLMAGIFAAVLWLALRAARQGDPPPGNATAARATSGDAAAAAKALEPGPASDPLPKVALLVGESLGRCLRDSIEQVRRFTLVPTERIDQLAGAEHVNLTKPVTRQRARALAQQLGAELALHLAQASDGGQPPALAVVDVLTGDEVHRSPLPAKVPKGCQAVGKALVRMVLGEGEVTAVKGSQVTVNLGWRSRVAPGAKLQLLRAPRPGAPLAAAGNLVVTKVELDRCTAEGQARVGDLVRLTTR